MKSIKSSLLARSIFLLVEGPDGPKASLLDKLMTSMSVGVAEVSCRRRRLRLLDDSWSSSSDSLMVSRPCLRFLYRRGMTGPTLASDATED
jgi:hypothetical protein